MQQRFFSEPRDQEVAETVGVCGPAFPLGRCMKAANTVASGDLPGRPAAAFTFAADLKQESFASESGSDRYILL